MIDQLFSILSLGAEAGHSTTLGESAQKPIWLQILRELSLTRGINTIADVFKAGIILYGLGLLISGEDWNWNEERHLWGPLIILWLMASMGVGLLYHSY